MPDSPAPPSALRLHQVNGFEPGPRLIVLGAVHGNETCGTRAIERVLARFDAGRLALVRGAVSFVPVTNPLAYRLGQRQGERNLNRNLRPNATPVEFEDRVANALCPLLAAHDVLLDLHSFHTGGEPFGLLGPPDNQGEDEPFGHAAAEERLCAHLGPRRFVEGWMQAYGKGVRRRRSEPGRAGPQNLRDIDYGVGTTEYMRRCGGYGVTLECGQHHDPAAPDVGERAILQTLSLLGLIDEPPSPPASDLEVLSLVDVVDRDHADDAFARNWASFDVLAEGELIGHRADGREVRAPQAGFIVFPNPRAQPGNEWFYLALRSTRRFATGG